MAIKAPTTMTEYIEAAPPVAQPHLRRLYGILSSVAPEAEETIKWSTPFFVEPRFLFSFAAHKAHCSLAPTAAAMEAFRGELANQKTTKNTVQFPYSKSLPEDLVRRIAEYCVRAVEERQNDSFW